MKNKPIYTELLPHKIIASCKEEQASLNIAGLAEKLGISYTGLWYCMTGRRKWTAELWLKTLVALGVVKVYKNKITIDVDASVCGELETIDPDYHTSA